jgi:calcineurin-like phosphoesterase
VWRHTDLVPLLESSDRVLRPANLGGVGAPGRGTTVRPSTDGTPVAVVNLEGALFMDTQVHPFLVAEDLVERSTSTRRRRARRSPSHGCSTVARRP